MPKYEIIETVVYHVTADSPEEAAKQHDEGKCIIYAITEREAFLLDKDDVCTDDVSEEFEEAMNALA